MCGIFAVLSRREPIREDYRPLLDHIRHRGPDDMGSALVSLVPEGGHNRARAWLGHTRLSILDLSSRGRQPMTVGDGRFIITFNGEIYNYVELRQECRAAGARFVSDTDTEVLLQAWQLWGEDCLNRVKGMFSFVIIDRCEGIAVIGRDHFGIKPLYYSETEDRIVICSEVQPILHTRMISAELNKDIVFEYLRFGATNSNDRTILRDVKCLSPAHIATFDFKTGMMRSERCYWKLHSQQRTISFSDAVAECRERFINNVRLHLRSDVPVGAALSGGIDSSAVVCVMRMLEPDLNLQTFSYISDDPAYSEERWVDVVHRQVGGVCHKIRPKPAELGDDLEYLVRRQGEPFGSASMYAQYRVFRRAREEGVPVTLDGQGADEVLGGYWPHVGTYAAERMRSGHFVDVWNIVTRAAPGLQGVRLMSAMLAQSILPDSMRNIGRWLVDKRYFPEYLDQEWFDGDGVSCLRTADNMIGRFKTLKQHLISTVERGSLPNLLRYADRNSMAFSVESRVPFLTHDFAEYLMSLPPDYLVSRMGTRKYIFREAMKGIIPEEIRRRPDKIGFFADDGLWLRKNAERFKDVWEELQNEPMFQRAKLNKFVDDFMKRRHESALLVWRALVFGIWLRGTKAALAYNAREF